MKVWIIFCCHGEVMDVVSSEAAAVDYTQNPNWSYEEWVVNG